MHDQELPVNVQCTSVRLMLNLVEVLVARSKNTSDRSVIEQHRQLLQQMLVTHLAKLTTLERQVPKLIAAGLSVRLYHRQGAAKMSSQSFACDLPVSELLC
jgi:hypothetical protein